MLISSVYKMKDMSSVVDVDVLLTFPLKIKAINPYEDFCYPITVTLTANILQLPGFWSGADNTAYRCTHNLVTIYIFSPNIYPELLFFI